jgi:hypothetical protein
LKVYWILLGIFVTLTAGSCSPLVSAPRNVAVPTATNNPHQNVITQFPSDDSSGNSVSAINTPDFSEIPAPPAEANAFVRLVEEDLAKRLGIAIDQIHFVKISDIDWQEITQGCNSSPGHTIRKGQVNGYRIWLEASGKNYLYHIGLDNTIFRCPD